MNLEALPAWHCHALKALEIFAIISVKELFLFPCV